MVLGCSQRFALRCLSVTLEELRKALTQMVEASELGRVSYEVDEVLAAKLSGFHQDMSAERARRLGMVADARH